MGFLIFVRVARMIVAVFRFLRCPVVADWWRGDNGDFWGTELAGRSRTVPVGQVSKPAVSPISKSAGAAELLACAASRGVAGDRTTRGSGNPRYNRLRSLRYEGRGADASTAPRGLFYLPPCPTRPATAITGRNQEPKPNRSREPPSTMNPVIKPSLVVGLVGALAAALNETK